MKKITTILMMFIAVSSFAQLKVKDIDTKPDEVIGEYKMMGVLYGTIEREKDICIFTYKDTKFKQITEYKHFMFKQSDLDALYDILTNTEGVNEGDQKEVELENGDKLRIVYKKSMGKIWSTVYHTDKAGVEGEFSFAPKHYQKLFGKKKK